jgi:hypothetical protein
MSRVKATAVINVLKKAGMRPGFGGDFNFDNTGGIITLKPEVNGDAVQFAIAHQRKLVDMANALRTSGFTYTISGQGTASAAITVNLNNQSGAIPDALGEAARTGDIQVGDMVVVQAQLNRGQTGLIRAVSGNNATVQILNSNQTVTVALADLQNPNKGRRHPLGSY